MCVRKELIYSIHFHFNKCPMLYVRHMWQKYSEMMPNYIYSYMFASMHPLLVPDFWNKFRQDHDVNEQKRISQ